MEEDIAEVVVLDMRIWGREKKGRKMGEVREGSGDGEMRMQES